jgi:hypothetical protein
VGSEAAAKRRAAIAFSQALLCKAPRLDGDACGVCRTCEAVGGTGHADVRIWDVPEGEKTFKVEQVRELIARVQTMPLSAPRQVQILAALDQMTPTGWNALLKTLEEPPPTTIIVLLARDLAGVLPTLVSRCQLIRFGPAPVVPEQTAPPPLPAPETAMAWADGLAAKNQDEQAAALSTLLVWIRDQAVAAPADGLTWVARAEPGRRSGTMGTHGLFGIDWPGS